MASELCRRWCLVLCRRRSHVMSGLNLAPCTSAVVPPSKRNFLACSPVQCLHSVSRGQTQLRSWHCKDDRRLLYDTRPVYGAVNFHSAVVARLSTTNYGGAHLPQATTSALIGTLNLALRQQKPLSRTQWQWCRRLTTDVGKTAEATAEKRQSKDPNGVEPEEEKSLSIFQRVKLLWKRYWYIVIPVDLVTSTTFFTAFYFLSASGVNVIELLEWMHLPESWVNLLKHNPNAGHVAVALILFKLSAPVRYAIVIGGTHVTMKALSRLGLIPTTREVRTRVDGYVTKQRDHMRLERARLKLKYAGRFASFRRRLSARRRIFSRNRRKNKK